MNGLRWFYMLIIVLNSLFCGLQLATGNVIWAIGDVIIVVIFLVLFGMSFEWEKKGE